MNCSFNVRSYINVQLNTLIFENFLWDRNDQFKRSIFLVICKGTRFFDTYNPSALFFYRLSSFLSIGQVILYETTDSFNKSPVLALKKRKIQTIVQTSRFSHSIPSHIKYTSPIQQYNLYAYCIYYNVRAYIIYYLCR